VKCLPASNLACEKLTMSLVLQEKVQAGAEFALWKIEEGDDYYLQKLVLSEAESGYINSIKHPAQKTRWLASRFLLKHLMRTDAFVELQADVHGKPFINNFPLHVSISHSNTYAAVIISEHALVGIDVEEVARNIEPMKHKFLSQAELHTLIPETINEQLLLYWAAKEVMYKMYAKRKLEFKDDMFVKPFSVNKHGSLEGILSKHDEVFHFHLSYFLSREYVVVFGVEPATAS
jgi:4'-phosphopantetheinyl transferase EntD